MVPGLENFYLRNLEAKVILKFLERTPLKAMGLPVARTGLERGKVPPR